MTGYAIDIISFTKVRMNPEFAILEGNHGHADVGSMSGGAN